MRASMSRCATSASRPRFLDHASRAEVMAEIGLHRTGHRRQVTGSVSKLDGRFPGCCAGGGLGGSLPRSTYHRRTQVHRAGFATPHGWRNLPHRQPTASGTPCTRPLDHVEDTSG